MGRLCGELEGHGGDRTKVQEVTRDMAEACSLGVAAEMPQAVQTVDRFHVVQLLNRAIDHVRCAERRESAEKRRQLAGTKYVWLQGKESLTERQLAKREELDPAKTHLRTARACQMGEALQDVYSCAGRESAARALDRLLLMDDALQCQEMKTVARTLRKEREGHPELVEEGLHKLVPGRAELRRPVGPQRCKGLQEHRLFQDDDLPPAGPPGLHGPEEADMRYPLETSKSPFWPSVANTSACHKMSDVSTCSLPKSTSDGNGKSAIGGLFWRWFCHWRSILVLGAIGGRFGAEPGFCLCTCAGTAGFIASRSGRFPGSGAQRGLPRCQNQAKVVLDKEVTWGDVAQLALIELALNRCAVQNGNASPRPDAQLDGGDAGDLERACEVVKIEVARGEVLL